MNWLRYSIFAIIGGVLIFILLYLQHPLFWKRPSWERLKRIKQSPHYKYFQFKKMTYSKISPRWNSWLNLIKKAKEGVRPPIIPHIQTDLHKLEKNINAIIWLWHSAFFMQLDWKTFLVDPTLVTWSPIPFVNKAFPWADTYDTMDWGVLDNVWMCAYCKIVTQRQLFYYFTKQSFFLHCLLTLNMSSFWKMVIQKWRYHWIRLGTRV